jgi:serine/threonine-protein kinase RsbW
VNPFKNDSETLHVQAVTANLSTIREFVRSRIKGCGFTALEENNIVLAVDEACANLIQHAYKNDPSFSIDIAVHLEPRSVKVYISDTSAPFNPNSAELPDMRRYFAEHRHHGLGILLMTKVMDMVEYVPAGTGTPHNTLVLTKQRLSRP